MPSFSEQLRHEAEPIWRRIFDHPFLKEIKDGTLPLETFQYYLAQDYLYLEGFGRTVAMALAKAPSSQTFEELAHRVLTAQLVAGDRFLLGVGAGSTRGDFVAVDKVYDDRMALLHDGLATMRLLWAGETVDGTSLNPLESVRGGRAAVGGWRRGRASSVRNGSCGNAPICPAIHCVTLRCGMRPWPSET